MWVTSDTHFGHSRIAKYCGRPSNHEDLMLEGLKMVEDGDFLIHLGDFALCPLPKAREFFDKIKGVKILVEGNHDVRGKIRNLPWFWVVRRSEQPGALLYRDSVTLLQHTPTWPENAVGDLRISGHVHDRGIPLLSLRSTLNVCACVELWGYRPIDLGYLIEVWKACR